MKRDKGKILQTKHQSEKPGAFQHTGLWLSLLGLFVSVIFVVSLLLGTKSKRDNLHEEAKVHIPPQAKTSMPWVRAVRAESTEEKPYTPEIPQQSISLGFRTSDYLVYDFFQTRILTLEVSSIAGTVPTAAVPPPAELQIKQMGTLVVRVYDENEKGWMVGFELQGAAVEMNSGHVSTSGHPDDLATAMQGEILAFVLKHGRIEKLTVPTTMSADGRNHWRDILARWQVLLPNNDADMQWSRTEEDATGVYVADYSRESTATPAKILKHKRRYLKISTPHQSAFVAKNVVSGVTTIDLDPYQIRIEGGEHFRISAAGTGVGVNSEAVFSFRLKHASSDPAIVQTGAAKVAHLASVGTSLSWAGEIVLDAGDGDAAQTHDTNDMAIKKELTVLKQLFVSGKADTVEEVQSLERISALIKRDDTVIDAMLDELTKDSPTVDMASALIGVLGAAGTPMSQFALLSLATAENWSDEQREMALFSFVQVMDPIPEVDNWLQDLHQRQGSLATNALLVLAAMGDRLRDTSPERFENISEYVISAASTPDLPLNERIVALDAIRNLGPREVPDIVQSALRSDDALIRQHAMLSLEKIHTETASNMIMNAIRNDPVDSVRTAAVKLLADTRRVGGSDALRQIVISDGSEQVRIEALMSLNEWANSDPTAIIHPCL